MTAVEHLPRPFGLPADSIEIVLDLPVSDAQLIELYNDLGSVWKVGAKVGLTGQRVHKRFREIGYDISRPPEFTLEQIEQVKAYYQNTPDKIFDQAAFAKSLGKSRHNVARLARRIGLTRQNRLRRPDTIEKMREKAIGKPGSRHPRQWKRGHPRGFLGRKHSDEAKAVISKKSRLTWATQKTFGGPLVSEEASQRRSERMRIIAAARPASANYSNRRAGRRVDLDNLYVRSSWEANYARYLNFLKKIGVVEEWEYEPEVFWFEGIRRGVTNYKPDFRVKFKGEATRVYVEIKGWIVTKDKTKWDRMKKYHPGIKLQIVKSKDYYAIQKKWASCIPEWEFPARHLRWAPVRSA